MNDYHNLLQDSMDHRVLNIDDGSAWRLTKMPCAKSWEGWKTKGHPAFTPSEAHAVYEAEQLQGTTPGLVGIIKVRVENPANHWDLEPPEVRAEYACGGAFNPATEQECTSLENFTEAECTVTPKLIIIQQNYQDESILRRKGGGPSYWMPGGYVVWIVMEKLPAIPLSLGSYWGLPAQERKALRASFKDGYYELLRLGYCSTDPKLENLMWDAMNRKCYFIDLEAMEYDVGYIDWTHRPWRDFTFAIWNLSRDGREISD